MRLERLTMDKIKIFLTYDDLYERGMTKEDLWHDAPKVHQLFRDMMKEASVELGFEAVGPIAVEVFSMQAQGMVIIMTKAGNHSLDDDYDEDYIEMQVTLDESDDIFYEFVSFEDFISLSAHLIRKGVERGRLYAFENRYFYSLSIEEVTPSELEGLVAILAEFGSPSTLTKYRVEEYGKVVIPHSAPKVIDQFFLST
ncbi:genetic competence negative regulator [Bacillaceae bacterium SIJ1]|uniref:genetic competence negative regulator n=1 Tax=Litoribacterium kuwaitense TaxID=1398745 RepID=UPI0013E9ADCF|nr:genetic competence negative regulator [Litoribacterium kuwaitense]NGP43682.1 genetic competence negative regulator [Litoribacterium kuwaitense]